MTHSLHRTGSVEDLEGDYVFIVRRSPEMTPEVWGPKMRRMAEILLSVGPCNIGSTEVGGSTAGGITPGELVERAPGVRGIYCAFSNRDRAKDALRRIKEEELGLCVTVSGLIDEVFSIGRELDLPPHTVNLSLGVVGRTELLPRDDVLDMSTMCGHATVSPNLIAKVLDDLASGRITLDQAAGTLGAPCVCGIFNLDRARRQLSAAGHRPSARGADSGG